MIIGEIGGVYDIAEASELFTLRLEPPLAEGPWGTGEGLPKERQEALRI